MADIFQRGKCPVCGGYVLDRPDNLPFCSECERKMTQQYAEKIRPDKAKAGKVELFSEMVKAE